MTERHSGFSSRRVLGVVAVVLLVVVTFSGSTAAHDGDGGVHHHDGWMGMHDGAIGGWGLLWLLPGFALLIGVPVVLSYLILTDRGAPRRTIDDDALEILRRRYAEGEIDEEEFESRREMLRDESN